MGECPINAVSFINEQTNSIDVFLLRNPNNPLIENNISVINVLTNKVDEGYNGLLKIVDKNNMNSSNDAIVSNVHTVSDYFNKKYVVNP